MLILEKRIWITCLKLNNKKNTFLSSKNFMKLIIFFYQNCLVLNQNWLYIKRKTLWKKLSTMATKQFKFRVFYCNYYAFFLNNWKYEFHLKNRTSQVNNKNITLQSLQCNARPQYALGLMWFYFKVWIYLTCQQQQEIDDKFSMIDEKLNILNNIFNIFKPLLKLYAYLRFCF